MEATVVIAFVDAAIGFLEKAIPSIEAAVKKGEISPEVQQAQLDRLAAIKSSGFSGPEWQKS